jgi:hypothetical protein
MADFYRLYSLAAVPYAKAQKLQVENQHLKAICDGIGNLETTTIPEKIAKVIFEFQF